MTQLLSVGVDELIPDPTQPRKSFLKDEIGRLAASISARGVLLPLRVAWDGERQKWRIITGECRWRAAVVAELTHVPCLPVEGELTDIDILSDQIIENSVRNSLKPMELARALAKLQALKGCTGQTLAKELGISGAELSKSAKLLLLPEDIQMQVDDGAVPESTAYAISRLPDASGQRELADAVAAGTMTRKAVEDAVAAKVGTKQMKPKDSHLSCRIDGVAVSLAGDSPLTLNMLITVFRRLIREASAAGKAGESVTDLAARLKASSA